MTLFNINDKNRLFMLPFLGGVFYALGFPSKYLPNFFLFPIIGLALYLLSLNLDFFQNSNNEFRFKPRFISFLSFSAGFNIVGFYWIPYTLSEFGNLVFPFNYLIGLLFSLIILPQHFIFILLIKVFKTLKIKSSSAISSPVRRTCFFALLISLLEYFIPQQFPAHPGHTWLTLAPFLKIGQFFGVVLYSFFSYWLSLTLAFFIQHKSFLKIPTILFSLFLVTNFFFKIDAPNHDLKEELKLRIVQPNIGNFLKISSEKGDYSSIYEVLEYYKKLSIIKNKKVDLIIWPETAFPSLMNSSMMKKSNTLTPPTINEVTQKSKTFLLTGGYDRKSNRYSHFKNEYNAAFLFNPDGTLRDVYHKRKLIPFGESLPFGPFNEMLSKVITNISFFAEGERYTQFKLDDYSFITAICYEVLFPSYIRDYLNSLDSKPDFLINLTNDSWYGDTSEPLQHLYLAKWRAIEFNLPIVRSTNTGITSILYEDGSESFQIGVFKRTSKDFDLFIKQRTKTLYQEYGIILTLFLILGIYLLAIGLEKLSIRKP